MEIVICAIARLENLYVKEWVDYHLSMGFTHIYLYDNNRAGEERLAEVLNPEINYPNKVTIFPYHDVVNWPQMQAYGDFWNRISFDWAFFIDVDEFFTFGPKWKGSNNVAEFVNLYSDKAEAILINWMTYGDNEEIFYKPEGVISRFPKPLPLKFSLTNSFGKQPVNGHVKTMVKHTADFHLFGPHVGQGDYVCCNAEGAIVENKSWNPQQSYSIAYLRHYTTKTVSEFIESKSKRGLADRKPGVRYSLDTFFLYNKPTFKKIRIYEKARKQEGLEGKPLLWWIKQYIKHWIITPLFVR